MVVNYAIVWIGKIRKITRVSFVGIERTCTQKSTWFEEFITFEVKGHTKVFYSRVLT